jgi:eukaryotic-like serine/threonine-protein kinase
MSLSAGSILGPYEILSALGAGGMGEVYRARDTKLNRDVALKILPDSFTHDADRVARFRREAQVLASLNHPHIGAIYGLDQAHEQQFLVLELVDGETLADRIKPGPLPIDEAVAIARQIAEALEAAHDKGIIHRDLKPANIALTKDGRVKVLDFGLAKATDAASGAAFDLTNSPTLTSPAMMTGVGVILGTASYMSPEQARGRPADKRSDIWAFGCVFYEMLTGKRAFEGEDVSDTLADVLRGEPSWNTLTPPARPLASLLKRCLEKDVKRRLRDIGDARLLLDDAGVFSDAPPPAATAIPAWWIATVAALGLIVGSIAGAVVVRWRSETVPVRVARFELTSSPAHPFTTNPRGVNVAISPDGSRIVYTATYGTTSQLVIRRLDQLEATPIAGTDGASSPFFSPDGQQIGFLVGADIRKVAIAGGPSVAVCRVSIGEIGAGWDSSDSIVFAQGNGRGLFSVPASGGQPQNLFVPDSTKGEANYFQPVVLPGGQALLYTVVQSDGQTRIVARRFHGSDVATVVEGGFGGRYVASGHIVYGQDDRVMAVPFDVATLRTTGSSVPVQDGVFTKIDQSIVNLVSAADGTTAYVSGRNAGMTGRPVWVDRGGKHVARVVEQAIEAPRYPRLSSDGRALAVTVGPNARGDVWTYDLRGAAQPLKLTFQGHNIFPIFSPDGKRIVFASPAGSANHMSSIPADGSATDPERLTTNESAEVPQDWSPDGAFILFSLRGPQTRTDLWLLHVGDRKVRPWLQTPFEESEARFSPDGHWVALVSDQTGRPEVWVRPFPGPGAPVRVSPDGGRNPVWSRDGHELFYEDGLKVLSARVVSQAPDLRFEKPQVLFESRFVQGSMRSFDVAPDGRFLMIEAIDTAPSASIVVVQNWFEELKRLAPTK